MMWYLDTLCSLWNPRWKVPSWIQVAHNITEPVYNWEWMSKVIYVVKIAPHGSTWHLFQDGTVDYAAFVRWLMTSETWRLRAKFANKQTLRFMSDQVFGYGWNRVCTVLIYWYFIYIYIIYIMYTVYSIPYIICMYSLDICTYVDTWLYICIHI